MLIGWLDLFRNLVAKRRTDFASVDARRFSNSPKNYEMINSVPPRTADDTMIKAPESVVTSPPPKEYGLSPLVQSPRSSYSHYTNSVDYFGKDVAELQNHQYVQEAEYKSPKLSFSTPRPPSASAGASFPSGNVNTGRSFFPRTGIPLRGRDSPSSTYSNPPPSRGHGRRSLSPAYEWDATTTYARPSQRQGPYQP